jgi:GntR family transcriptional regulator
MASKLKRTAARARKPVYSMVMKRMLQLIRDGGFAAGDRFLTERQISERYAVSRPTANKALSNLVSAGMLEFRKGVGTFVKKPVFPYDLHRLVSFSEKARALGMHPVTDVLEFRLTDISEVESGAAERLRHPGGDRAVYFMRRLRIADGNPVILERRYLVAELCPGLTEVMLRGSLYRLIAERFGLQISRADHRIKVHPLEPDEARLLGLPRGSQAIEVTGTASVVDGTPLWWEQTLYRLDTFEFRLVLGEDSLMPPEHGVFMDPHFNLDVRERKP